MNDKESKNFHADVGDARFGVSSQIGRQALGHKGDDELTELDENLNGLTLDIPNASIDDLPRRYQRHTIVVSGRFSRMLWRVARDIMCYHEHH